MYTTHYPRNQEEPKMTLKIEKNGMKTEIKAVCDDCSYYTILNEYPEEEEKLEEYDKLCLDTGTGKIEGRLITGNVFFNDKPTTGNILYAKNHLKNIIGWKQLHDMELLEVNKNRKLVIDVPPVLIDTGTEKPGYASKTYLRGYLIGDAKRVIASWVRKGIIERTKSICNSSVTLGIKTNGKVKIKFHFDDLNKCAEPMLPGREINRHKVIAGVPLGNYYSVIKLFYGEWQIPLDTNTKYKTAFTFLGHQYVWNRLPGGFRDTTAILNKTLGQVLDKLPQNERKPITYYIDSMLISADNEEECRRLTYHLWRHLKDSGFKMNKNDKQICQPHVEYLGRKITPEGIQLGEIYLQKVNEIKPPTCAGELRSILARLEDARRFTPGFGVFAKDLYKLSEKNDWCWDDEHKALLYALRCEILKNRLVVPHLTQKGPCIVQIFVIDESWMAEVFNNDKKPYLSESGTFKPVKNPQHKAVKEIKAIKEAWSKMESEMEGRNITWEVECPEVARFKEDPNSLNINKNLEIKFLFSPQHTIKVVPSDGRKLPIQWPVQI